MGIAAGVGWQFVVDNGDQGYSETGTSWVTYAWGSAYNGDYRYLSHLGHTVERKGTATWQITIPVSGTYQVAVHFRPTENRTTDADYHVYDGNGKIHKHTVDQTYNGPLTRSGWYTLGNYDWERGHTAKIVLDGSDDTESDEADAVRWLLVKVSQMGPVDLTTTIASSLLLNNVKVNLQGQWIETGGYDTCYLKKTYLITNFNYGSKSYLLTKYGGVQDAGCNISDIKSYKKYLSGSGREVSRKQFITLMRAVFSKADNIYIKTFTPNFISYVVNYPDNSTQTRLLKRQ